LWANYTSALALKWFTSPSRFFGGIRAFYAGAEAAKVGVRPSYMTLIAVFCPTISNLVGEGVFLAQSLQVQVIDCMALLRRTSLSPAGLVLCFLQDIVMVIE